MVSQHSRRGFSLMELLVVIGIIAVIMALVLPAIQKVREVANRMVCGSNLRQLGIAAHHYQIDHGRLPPGYLGPSLANNANATAFYKEGQAVGHLPLLLPYLEKDKTFGQFQIDFDLQAVTKLPWFWLAANVPHDINYSAGHQEVKLLRCPSAANYAPQMGNPKPGGGGTITGLHVFHDGKGIQTVGWRDAYVTSSKYSFLGRTNYVGVAGCGTGTHPLYRKYIGIYTNRSRLTLGQIAAADGTSNTLFYGETVGSQWDGSPADSLDISWVGGGALGTYLGTLHGRDATAIAFSSYHPGGVPFCFADGSVRPVRFVTPLDAQGKYTAAWFLLQQLAGYKDADNADTTGILE